MARVDRRHAAGQQEQKRRLRPLQHKGDRVIAFGRDLVEIAVPRLARVEAQFLGRLAGQHVPGAFDIGGGERLSVMPFDVVAELEYVGLLVVRHRPGFGKTRLWRQRGAFVGQQTLINLSRDDCDRHRRGRDGGKRGRLGMVDVGKRPAGLAALLRERAGGQRQQRRHHDQGRMGIAGHRSVSMMSARRRVHFQDHTLAI